MPRKILSNAKTPGIESTISNNNNAYNQTINSLNKKLVRFKKVSEYYPIISIGSNINNDDLALKDSLDGYHDLFIVNNVSRKNVENTSFSNIYYSSLKYI